MNLEKHYRGRAVVHGVSFEVAQGEIVGLLGPNGAGKTTSFYTVVGLIRPDAGTVLLDDVDLTHAPMYQRAQAGIGYLAQEPSVFRKMTVEDNVLAILEFQPGTPEQHRIRCAELLEEFGLTSLRKTRGDLLSGGERRRTEIARCLAAGPKYVLLDEPFAGVDPIAVGEIRHLVSDLTNRGIGVLITDHNVQDTLQIVDRAYILHDGKVLMSGTTQEVVKDDNVRRVYLGNNFRVN